MEESKIRSLILEEIQGIINQISIENEENFDTEIGKDPV